MAILTPGLVFGLCGYSREGGSTGVGAFGSIDDLTFLGYEIDYIITSADGDGLGLIGDDLTATPPVPFITVNGNNWTLGSGSLASGVWSYGLTTVGGEFSSGVPATVNNNTLPASGVRGYITPDTTANFAPYTITPALPAAAGGYRTLTQEHKVETPGVRYIAHHVQRIGSSYPPFSLLATSSVSWSGYGGQIAANNLWYAAGIVNNDMSTTTQVNATSFPVSADPTILEGWLDTPNNGYRMQVPGGGQAFVHNSESLDLAFNWTFLNTYNDTFRLFHLVVMTRVPNLAERAAIRAWMTSVPVITPPVFVTPATVYAQEQSIFSHQLRIDKQVTSFSITGGADSAAFTINGSNQLRFVGDSLKTYDSPDDVGANGVYNVNVQATDFESETVTQNLTVTLQRKPVFAARRPAENESDGDNFMDDNLVSEMKWKDFLAIIEIIGGTIPPNYVGTNWLARYVGIRAADSWYVGPRPLV